MTFLLGVVLWWSGFVCGGIVVGVMAKWVRGRNLIEEVDPHERFTWPPTVTHVVRTRVFPPSEYN